MACNLKLNPRKFMTHVCPPGACKTLSECPHLEPNIKKRWLKEKQLQQLIKPKLSLENHPNAASQNLAVRYSVEERHAMITHAGQS